MSKFIVRRTVYKHSWTSVAEELLRGLLLECERQWCEFAIVSDYIVRSNANTEVVRQTSLV